ncbi:MAG: type I methionyl aminopeptidase [Bacilli bacterium]|nr:type I methionyl aminopeptidase [Bacilli bacterium]
MISIKTKEEINKIKESGTINYLTHEHLKKLIIPGITTNYLNEEADKFIRKHGGIPSFLNYQGFPKSICVSVNDEIVHGIPSDKVLKEGDIVSIDIGVLKDGYHSDSARTHAVGKISKTNEKLIYHTEKMLYKGLSEIKDGASLGNIGFRIIEHAKKYKYSVVRELVGHGIGKNLHEDPDVPNYGKYNTGIILKTGMVIAVEPMINLGKRYIKQLDNDEWTIFTKDKKNSAHFEHTVVVTDEGYEILTGE